MISQDFLDNLPDDPVAAIHEISKNFFTLDEHCQENPEDCEYADYLEFLALLEVYSRTHNINIPIPVLSEDRKSNLELIRRIFREAFKTSQSGVDSQTLRAAKERFSINLGKAFHYEFSEGDLERVQQLINELRSLITSNNSFEEEHKHRLLKRLEKLQSELHKKVSDLDRFWGLIGDAGVVLGKFGEDAKPFVDRIKEITEIIWRTQSRAEELPSSAPYPQLEGPSTKRESQD